jgi:hypothetical protein
MISTKSYTTELEYLIRDILLPVYDRYYREQGRVPEYTKINPHLLRQIVRGRQVPRLLQPPHDKTFI